MYIQKSKRKLQHEFKMHTQKRHIMLTIALTYEFCKNVFFIGKQGFVKTKCFVTEMFSMNSQSNILKNAENQMF